MDKDPKLSSTDTVEAVPLLRDPAKRAILFQVAVLLIVAGVGYYLVDNTVVNLKRLSIASGFGFLEKEASFEIGESVISYSASDTYLRALTVGVLNTIKVSFIGSVLAVLLGTLVGIARLSTNWLVSRIAGVYIEVLQDIPVLLQLFFWYAIFYEVFPGPRQAINPIAGVFMCNRGLIFAVPAANPAWAAMGVALLASVVLIWWLRRWARLRQERTGQVFPVFVTGILLLIGLPLMTWAAYGAPTAMSIPHLKGFNFNGGMALSPEFGALLLGLVLYTSAFVAEIVRAGIQSVGHGQTEAAMALGLRPGRVLHLVVLPQALRVIIPPLTNQMLNLTKNSSLAVAIGYPEFVSVANTTINQTGQAIEGIALIMVVYLCISLLTSLFMNWYNKKTALVER